MLLKHTKYYYYVLLASLIIMVSGTWRLKGQSNDLGIFESHGDIGMVKHQGSASYDEDQQQYFIEGSGTNMWSTQDEFQYLWKSIQGDFILSAEVKFIGTGGDPHRKIGWMVRENLKNSSAHVNATVHGDGLASLQFRTSEGALTEEIKSNIVMPDYIQLERRDSTFIMSVARKGDTLSTVEVRNVRLRNEVFVGIYVCSHNPEVIEKAVFQNVRIVKPASPSFQPYRDYIGSMLEVMEVETGDRKVLLTSAHSLQAPNWTPDGKYLIYNSNGLLYKYDLDKKSSSVLNTGFANRNNNDHVLSFDGKQIAISHHNANDHNNSTIYTLPIEGSDSPKQITSTGAGHSYFHGWSPDAKYLVFTGFRDNDDTYNIIKVSIASGEETQLTNKNGLDDGPEYSRDGKYIYFNSTRTGKMKLWRMNEDGSNPIQLTFDQYNDWFPHVSPDNKEIIFLSFMPDVPPFDHPFYKHVMIRKMDVAGGPPKVITYLYGGQGTINVPSWSPDGKYVAFISNSDIR